jgi:hypothetical protein
MDLPPPPTIEQIRKANADNLLEGLNNVVPPDPKTANRRQRDKYLPENFKTKGGSKRNKKSVRRLVKKRTAKRRNSRRVKH